MKSDFSVIEITDYNQMPFELLLLADPSLKLVDEYVKRGKVYGGYLDYDYLDAKLIGVFVLIKTRPETLEIVNIAVKDTYQGKGYAKEMIQVALIKSKEAGAKTVEIGTGNAGINQMALYQKCGFRITGVDRDFFRRHYDEPIFENGIECIDMIRLSQDI